MYQTCPHAADYRPMTPASFLLRRGFTLLELSVVLTIIAVILGGGLAIFTVSLQSAAFNKTVERMDAIEKALLDYSASSYRIPCPSDLTQKPGSASYGMEAANKGSCTGGSPAVNYLAGSGAAEGGVPTRALRLPDDYMYDAWGRRFRYAVDPAATAASALPVAGGCMIQVPSASAITVNDAAGAPRSTNAIYALVSHGVNGHGGYTSNGAVMSTGSVNASEQTNCHCNSGAVPTTYSATYVEKYPTMDSTNGLDNFDDIVTFREAWQMQTPNAPLKPPSGCPQAIFITDGNNCRVEEFSTSGAYIGQFGTCGSGSGQFNSPNGIAVDAKGNVWVTDYNNDNVQEFNSSGSWLQTIGSGGSGNGEFSEPTDIKFDSSANFWVVDKDIHRIQKFNTGGSWLMTIGGDKGDGTHTCTQCSSTTSCTCYSGTGNGQFTYPQGVAIDSSGNIWVGDALNDRIQQFNSSGSWLQTISPMPDGPSSGEPSYIAFDSSGNFWVATAGFYRDQQFNGSGSYLTNWLDKSNGFYPEGSANGLNYDSGGIAIDANGNIWITDPGNNRVQAFNSSGSWLRSIGGPPPYTCETSPSSSQPSCPAGNANGQFNAPRALAIGGR